MSGDDSGEDGDEEEQYAVPRYCVQTWLWSINFYQYKNIQRSISDLNQTMLLLS